MILLFLMLVVLLTLIILVRVVEVTGRDRALFLVFQNSFRLLLLRRLRLLWQSKLLLTLIRAEGVSTLRH
jgi:hypothetical protein